MRRHCPTGIVRKIRIVMLANGVKRTFVCPPARGMSGVLKIRRRGNRSVAPKRDDQALIVVPKPSMACAVMRTISVARGINP